MDIVEDTELKMWLAVRRDIEIPKGKLAVQAGHGYVTAILEAQQKDPHLVAAYMAAAQPKIAVWAKNEAELFKVHAACQEAGIPCGLIQDEGRTVFHEPTYTVLGIGPCLRSQLPSSARRLRMIPIEVETAANTEEAADV